MTRHDGRAVDQLRSISIERGVSAHAEGSALIKMGNTHVLCTASLETTVPGFLRGSGKGWVTAEYGMLPRSTGTRMRREASSGKQGGRTLEIQRLIGRSLRAAVNLEAMGENTIYLDCDVIQADGGTRTASITGAWVALADAMKVLVEKDKLDTNPLLQRIAAISVGVVNGEPVLDLDYVEDSTADTDMNVVINEAGGIIEVQGTAEGASFDRATLNRLLDLADKGVGELLDYQLSLM